MNFLTIAALSRTTRGFSSIGGCLRSLSASIVTTAAAAAAAVAILLLHSFNVDESQPLLCSRCDGLFFKLVA